MLSVSNNGPELETAVMHATPFDSEAALIAEIVKKLTQFFEGKAIFASTEVLVGAGTVDVVAAQLRESHIQQHKLLNVNPKEAYVLSKMYYKRRLTVATIARRTNTSQEQIETILSDLHEKELCLPIGRCYVRAELPFSSLIAIEGKIKNWRRALQQASRNRLFCSQSYVALDARYARPALRNIGLFKQYHVGLAIVFRNADVHILYRPPAERPLALIMPILAETALLDRITKNEAYSLVN